MPEYLVIFAKTGSALIEACDSEQALNIAETLTNDEVCWDDYFEPTDVQEEKDAN